MRKDKKEIDEILKAIPNSPGVYLMKDMHNKVIYVGKSKLLKNRVTSYFKGTNTNSVKTKILVDNIDNIEYIITDNEEEALILEATLIKENMPKFNILLKDDKQYPYILVTTNEKFPRVVKTRKIAKDGNKYFGPYSSAFVVNETLDIIHKTFKIRKCNRNLSNVIRPCLNYHIKQCIGPCVYGEKVKENYDELIEEILMFLRGKQEILLKGLKENMKVAAKDLNFEKAIEIRKKIDTVKELVKSQKVVNNSTIDQDIIGVSRNNNEICITIFFVRTGKLIDRNNYIITDNLDANYDEIIKSFILQFYTDTSFIPKEILIENNVEDENYLENYLGKLNRSKVNILIPLKGEKKKMIELVKLNANDYLKNHVGKHNKIIEKYNSISLEISKLIGVKDIKRIEAYDISNIYGVYNVGTMIVYENGLKKKNDYRKFKIKSIDKIDDYASMREMLTRRFSRLVDEYDEKSFSRWPNLILVDGGKGQVSVVTGAMKMFGIEIPVLGMVKDEKHKTRGLIYKNNEIKLEKNSFLYKFIYEIQEEVHRFSIEYHKNLRGKSITDSILDNIQGIGKKRKIELLKYFGEFSNLKKATVEELMKVPSMNQKTALSVFKYFKDVKDI